jgi:DNA-binding SARP family transcriptional activator
MLRVRLVGRPSLTLGEEPLDWPAGRRAGELLAWLALRPGAHTRADLAPRFWPDVLDESARASLRTALHELRRALGERGAGHLLSTRDAVALDDAAWVDVRALRTALAEGRDEEALALAGGDLLQGVDAEWVHAARAEHRDLVGRALSRLSARAAEAGDDAAAARLAR